MVQTSSAAVKPKTLECHNGLTTTKTNSIGNNNVVPTTMTLQNPTMLSQTQTRARVREIETCSSAACHPANECLHSNNNNSSSSNSRNNSKLLQQRKIHLTKSDNEQNNANTASKPQQSSNNSTTKPQGHQNATTDSDSAPEASNKAGNNSCTTGK